MAGTILITGANGSLAIPAVQHALSKYPDYTLLLTVRNASDSDVNTANLRSTIARFPDAKAPIRQLDHTKLSDVQTFASSVAADISAGRIPPLAAIACNAYYWNMVDDIQFTNDGYEKTIQVSHLAHVKLVLQLLGSFCPNGGRVVIFSSDSHWPGKNGMEKFPPTIPEELNSLVQPKPGQEPASDHMARGFQRYAVSKLAAVLWTYALNQCLEKVRRYISRSCNPALLPSLARGPSTDPVIPPGPKVEQHHCRCHQPWYALRLTCPSNKYAFDAILHVQIRHPSSTSSATLHGSHHAYFC